MTYQEYFEQLRSEFAKTSERYINTEKKMTQDMDGFFDKALYDEFVKARDAWSAASNDYNGFLSFVERMNINPYDEIPNQ